MGKPSSVIFYLNSRTIGSLILRYTYFESHYDLIQFMSTRRILNITVLLIERVYGFVKTYCEIVTPSYHMM
jgi:hypothetical protein